MTGKRMITFNEAILEATRQALRARPELKIIGAGVSDPKAVFGTTAGLVTQFPGNVIESPVSENAVIGIALGYVLSGGRAMVVHQRMDFMLYAMDQLVNNVAKWRSMFGENLKIPLVIRAIIGQGWGQGNQHSQNLQALFAQIPGLTVVTPSTPYNAKGLLLKALLGDSPTLFLEHRWLQEIRGSVPKRAYVLPMKCATRVRAGKHVTLVASSYWTLECFRAAHFLSSAGVEAEIIDLTRVSCLDVGSVVRSYRKTGALVVVDGAWDSYGLASEILARMHGVRSDGRLAVVNFPRAYVPSAPEAARAYYPHVGTIVAKVMQLLSPENSLKKIPALDRYLEGRVFDQPDTKFVPGFPES